MALFHSFLCLISIPVYVCVCLCIYSHIFTHSSVDGHLGCLHVLVIINSAAAMNMWVHVSFQIIVLFQIYAQGWHWWIIGQLYCFLMILHIVLHSCCISLHSHQQYRFFFSTPSPAFIVCEFFFFFFAF